MIEKLVDFQFNSCAMRLKDVRPRVHDAAIRAGCDEALAGQLVLVIDEAIANVIRHGYGGDDCGLIRLQISREDDQLVFRLHDQAEPVDPGCIKPRDLSEWRPGGLGINFIDSIMDSWEFQRPERGSGNVLRMTKTIMNTTDRQGSTQ